VAKDRQTKGEMFPQARLTEEDVRTIRRRYKKGSRRNGGLPLSREFRVDQATIYRIVRRIGWKHVTE